MLLLGKEYPMSSSDVDHFSQEMDHCKNTNTNMYTKIVNIIEKYRYTQHWLAVRWPSSVVMAHSRPGFMVNSTLSYLPHNYYNNRTQGVPKTQNSILYGVNCNNNQDFSPKDNYTAKEP